MNMFWIQAILLLCVVTQLQVIAREEPCYSSLAEFKQLEVCLGSSEELKKKGIKKAHAFKLGKVFLVGLAVGDSNVSAVMQLAIEHSVTDPSLYGYCTWYLNHPKPNETRDQSSRITAMHQFNHYDIVRSPSLLEDQEAISEIWNVVGKAFFEDSPSFLECAANQHYIALGCNGMVHRGPIVFGMLLAFSGCFPQLVLEIIDHFWDSDGFKNEVRCALMQKAYEYGLEHKKEGDMVAFLFSH